MENIKFTIDGRECQAKPGQTVTRAAKNNKIYIPTLCDFEGLNPAGTCRLCTCIIDGRYRAACTTKVEKGMVVQNDTPELQDIRKAIIELLYVEGNHQCAACEKSGACELQALAYRYRVLVPRFPYQFPVRQIESPNPKILIDANRCIQCMRCIRGVVADDGKHIFHMTRKEHQLHISVIPEYHNKITDEIAHRAMEFCPVGAILASGEGFAVPIGKRKFDNKVIGSDVEE